MKQAIIAHFGLQEPAKIVGVKKFKEKSRRKRKNIFWLFWGGSGTEEEE